MRAVEDDESDDDDEDDEVQRVAFILCHSHSTRMLWFQRGLLLDLIDCKSKSMWSADMSLSAMQE